MGPFLPWSRSFAAFSLLNVQHSVAAGTRVVGVLESLHEQRDQTAAEDQPATQTHSQASVRFGKRTIVEKQFEGFFCE